MAGACLPIWVEWSYAHCVCLSEFEPEPLPVQIVHREGRTSTAKIRTFIDLAKAMLGISPAKL